MKLSKSILKSMIRAIKMTRDEEIGCDECFDKHNDYAEMELAGKSPEEALPLVKDTLINATNVMKNIWRYWRL